MCSYAVCKSNLHSGPEGHWLATSRDALPPWAPLVANFPAGRH